MAGRQHPRAGQLAAWRYRYTVLQTARNRRCSAQQLGCLMPSEAALDRNLHQRTKQAVCGCTSPRQLYNPGSLLKALVMHCRVAQQISRVLLHLAGPERHMPGVPTLLLLALTTSSQSWN